MPRFMTKSRVRWTVESNCYKHWNGSLYQISHYAQYTPPTKIWKLNMLRIYPDELSCVGGVYTPVGCRDPVHNSAAYMWLAQKIGNMGHDWRLVRSHRRHDATRLRCRQIVQTRRDSSKLSPTSCEFNTHRRHNSTRQLSRIGVGGVYWA